MAVYSKVFEELLLDADWSLNAGNWMWLSASAFFHQYYRVYSPIAFGKKTDKHGDYIKLDSLFFSTLVYCNIIVSRKYLPVLKKYPSEYIYEPWKAPLSLQKTAGCIIGSFLIFRVCIASSKSKYNLVPGKDYPKPIVDHDIVMKENLAKMKLAYQGNVEG